MTRAGRTQWLLVTTSPALLWNVASNFAPQEDRQGHLLMDKKQQEAKIAAHLWVFGTTQARQLMSLLLKEYLATILKSNSGLSTCLQGIGLGLLHVS